MLVFSPKLIKERVREKRASRDALAKACDVDESTITRWLQNRHAMPAKVLPVLARQLNCDIQDFFKDA